jgi:hypothetical protein
VQGTTHQMLSLDVFKSSLPPMFWPWAAKVAENADLPDRLRDVAIGRFGTELAGHVLSATGHFAIHTSNGHFRGYCWRSDRSLWHCIRRFDPRIGDVSCITEPWVPILGRPQASRHPLALLLESLAGKADLDADSFTFPTAAVMASWVWSQVSRTSPLDLSDLPNPKAVGSVLHFIQDLCVPHHARGWMSHGHASFESRLAKQYEAEDLLALLAEAGQFIDPDHGSSTARGIVESCSLMSGGGLDLAKPEHACLVRAAGWTQAFLRRCVMAEL